MNERNDLQERLATYRELTSTERAQIDQLLQEDGEQKATLAAYQEMDQGLASLRQQDVAYAANTYQDRLLRQAQTIAFHEARAGLPLFAALRQRLLTAPLPAAGMAAILLCLVVMSLVWFFPDRVPAVLREMISRPQGEVIEMGPLIQVGATSNVIGPRIAVNPVNPSHLAIIGTVYTDLAGAGGETLLLTSVNGGSAWRQQKPFGWRGRSYAGHIAFGPNGTLYIAAIVGSSGEIAATSVGASEYETRANANYLSGVAPNDAPSLAVDPADGTLYVAWRGNTLLARWRLGVLHSRSNDGGQSWSEPIVVEPGIVPQAIAPQSGELAPWSVQVMPGKGDEVVVAWIWSEDKGPGEHFPATIWIARSQDGGQTFSEPQPIGQTWGAISTAFHDGTYYLLYRQQRQDRQELMLAVSEAGGEHWQTHLVSGDLPVYLYMDRAPGIDVAPDGTIDVVFYAHREEPPACLNVEKYVQRYESGWIDTCSYDVYYTFSRGRGRSFTTPQQLNEQPIVGERLLRNGIGISFLGAHIGMASTDDYAYPVWIGTEGTEGMQVWTRRVER